jgi:hypothetical protein
MPLAMLVRVRSSLTAIRQHSTLPLLAVVQAKSLYSATVLSGALDKSKLS